MSSYNIPSVESLRNVSIVEARKPLDELENRARKYIVNRILSNASEAIKERETKCIGSDYHTIGIDLYSQLISAGASDLFAAHEKHFLAVEKKDNGRCNEALDRFENCHHRYNNCCCYDDYVDNQNSYNPHIDMDVCKNFKYFSLCKVLHWPEVLEDLQAVLTPLGYSVCIVISREGDLGSYIRVVASFKNPNF